MWFRMEGAWKGEELGNGGPVHGKGRKKRDCPCPHSFLSPFTMGIASFIHFSFSPYIHLIFCLFFPFFKLNIIN